MPHESVWFETLSSDQQARLRASDDVPATADVLVVGAGLIGLAAAHFLCDGGARVVVIDRAEALGEASGANAGGLWYSQQAPELGPLLPLAQMSSRLYDELAQSLPDDIGLRRTGVIELGCPSPPPGSPGRAVSRRELQGLEPALSDVHVDARLYPRDGQVNPARLGAALVRSLRERGGRVCLRVQERRPDAAAVLIAAGAWTPLVTSAFGWSPPIRPVRGQLLATRPLSRLLRHTVLAPRFYYWQLPEGYVAGGGTMEDVDFERGVNTTDLAAIRAEMDALFPALRGEPTAFAWSGFRPCCDDLLPVIGRVPSRDRLFVAAGHFRKGIMLAPGTGKAVADLILRGESDIPLEACSPSRFGSAPLQ
jgi:glycine oxidase